MQDQDFFQPNEVKSNEAIKTSTGFMPKVLLIFGLGILLSAIVSLGMPYLYQAFGWLELEKGIAVRAYGDGLFIMMTVSTVVLLLFSLINQLILFKKGKMHWIMYILYSILMGIVISFTSMFVDFYTFGIAFGISAIAFLLMGLIGYFSKGKLNSFAIIGTTIILCSAVLSIFNWFLFGNEYLYWIITFGTLFSILLFVSFDFRTIKRYSEASDNTTGLAVLCAFILYNDFIYIFIRILQIAAVLLSKSKN